MAVPGWEWGRAREPSGAQLELLGPPQLPGMHLCEATKGLKVFKLVPTSSDGYVPISSLRRAHRVSFGSQGVPGPERGTACT